MNEPGRRAAGTLGHGTVDQGAARRNSVGAKSGYSTLSVEGVFPDFCTGYATELSEIREGSSAETDGALLTFHRCAGRPVVRPTSRHAMLGR